MPNILFEKSFASLDASKYWDYELNKNEKPENVSKSGNSKKYWMKCPNSVHKYQIFPSNVTHTGSGCPYPCCKGKKQLCKESNCDICFNASFASHEKSKYWNNTLNKDIIPRNIYKGYNCCKI